MFLIWCRPDREDIYDNFELEEHEMYDIDHIMEQFELYCEPICNFHAARYKLCHHYESLQYHLNVVKPTDKLVKSRTKSHFNRGGKQQQPSTKRTGTFRGQSSTRPANSSNKTVPCNNCGMTHPKDRCLAYQSTCFNCIRMGHYSSVCRSTNGSPSSTQNPRQFNRFHERGRSSQGRGFSP